MRKYETPSFRLPEHEPVDLSPQTVARYRALAEARRNAALVGIIRSMFRPRSLPASGAGRAPAPAE